ncbi:unnamed protein product [Chironomus riparius]|uniref:Pipsqueak n=1 Tax=Chironomus riparius TaxID=315576 RepID=A0A9P0J5G3_9DIPT|nr:unnamed protein product [Chironomus riparius]
MSSNTESSKKIMYPSSASTSNAKSSHNSSHVTPPKAHHMPKSSNSLPKHHANQILPNNINNNHNSHLNPHQYYSLRWNNYQNNLTDMFHELLNSEKFVDVTLACEHNSLKAHKVVLSACSSYFQKVLSENPCKHPVIIMPPEVAFADLQFIIEFVYRGEIDVSEAELQSLIRTAEQLKIKGLCEINDQTAAESDTEVIYPPHKKIRASRQHYESHHNHNNSSSKHREESTKQGSSASHSVIEKDAQPIASQDRDKRKSKSPIKDIGKNSSSSPASPSNQNQSKNMASLEMGMNGNVVMGVPLTYMDFAPEPPAPTATPVITTEVNCTPSHDTKDLSNHHTSTVSAHHPTVTSNSPIYTHHASPIQIITTCPSPVTSSMNDLSGLKTSIITTAAITATPTSQSQTMNHHQSHIHHHHLLQNHLQQSHQQHQQQMQHMEQMEQQSRQNQQQQQMEQQSRQNQHQQQMEQQMEQQSRQNQEQQQQQQQNQQQQQIPHIHTLHHTPQTITIHQARPIIQHHQIIETIKTEDVDIKPSIHDLMGVGNMDVDGQGNNNENVHGIIVTPEIANMMTTTPTSQIDSEDSKMQTDHNGSNGGQLQYITLGNNIPATSATTPTSDSKGGANNNGGPKTWTPSDMESALEALRSHNMSLTKASATYGIPSTTLWQRAHRLGIDTPKKEGPTKTWNEDSLNSALDALRTGTISANKASKAFGIPSSTLYKIARREGIRLAAPFNAAPTSWSAEDLEKALEAIRAGAASVQKASSEFGIPTGTLYGRCKREGIELSRSNPTPWSEDAMMEALEAVRVGQMSINQAAIHYNLPYSSLYGRFKRGKYGDPPNGNSHNDSSSHNTIEHSPENSISNYGHHTLIADTNVPQLQEQIIYQQHYSPSTQLIHQQPPQIYHHQQIIYHQSPPPHPQILQIHQIKKETS